MKQTVEVMVKLWEIVNAFFSHSILAFDWLKDKLIKKIIGRLIDNEMNC